MAAKIKQESIATVGLEKWLDDRRDRISQQNGLGFKEFKFFNRKDIRVPHSALGRMYGVNRDTIRKWKSYLEEEA